MLTELYVENFGPVKEPVTVQLTPIHALIGPNDSGKSTLLRALAAISGIAHGVVGWGQYWHQAPGT